MRLFSRRGALSSAASFSGIGVAPQATKPKGEDGDAEKPADEEIEGSKDASATPASPSAKSKEDDDCDDDDEEGDEEGDEEEMRTKGEKGKKVRSARLRERARIATIMQHPAALAHPDFALKMALTSSHGRGAICGMLAALPAMAAGNTLTARMAAHADQHAHPAPAALSGQDKIDQSWDRAIAKVTRPLGR